MHWETEGTAEAAVIKVFNHCPSFNDWENIRVCLAVRLRHIHANVHVKCTRTCT